MYNTCIVIFIHTFHSFFTTYDFAFDDNQVFRFPSFERQCRWTRLSTKFLILNDKYKMIDD